MTKTELTALSYKFLSDNRLDENYFGGNDTAQQSSGIQNALPPMSLQ